MDTPPEIVPITDFRKNAARIIHSSVSMETPVYITQCGYVTAVVLAPHQYRDLVRRAESANEAIGRLGRPQREDRDGLIETRYGVLDGDAADYFEAEGYEFD
jgi:PHD/YefM family antitoxin component YafN of YafNO toxin-antitoxin module